MRTFLLGFGATLSIIGLYYLSVPGLRDIGAFEVVVGFLCLVARQLIKEENRWM